MTNMPLKRPSTITVELCSMDAMLFWNRIVVEKCTFRQCCIMTSMVSMLFYEGVAPTGWAKPFKGVKHFLKTVQYHLRPSTITLKLEKGATLEKGQLYLRVKLSNACSSLLK